MCHMPYAMPCHVPHKELEFIPQAPPRHACTMRMPCTCHAHAHAMRMPCHIRCSSRLSQALPARRLALQRGASKANLLGTVPAVKSLDETRALISFLSSNVSLFRPAAMSTAALRRLVQRCSLVAIKADEVAAGRYVYVRGVPTSQCCLLLHGRLQIRAGLEGFLSEVGPWTTLGLSALTDPNYRPDFTARMLEPARILVITRSDLQAVQGKSTQRAERQERQSAEARLLYSEPAPYSEAEASPPGSPALDDQPDDHGPAGFARPRPLARATTHDGVGFARATSEPPGLGGDMADSESDSPRARRPGPPRTISPLSLAADPGEIDPTSDSPDRSGTPTTDYHFPVVVPI